MLGRIEVTGGTTDQYRTFYSCLYRSTLFPRKFYEIDAAGKPVHYSPYNGEVLPGYMYTDTGFWDTFRSLFPLLNLVYPSVNAEIQAGLANAYRESGFLPEWASPGHRGCMVGNNSASVVADAILKGVTPEEDVATLYGAMLAGRDKVHPTVSSTGRLGHEYTITRWAMYPTMQASTRMSHERSNMPTTTGVSRRWRKSWAGPKMRSGWKRPRRTTKTSSILKPS